MAEKFIHAIYDDDDKLLDAIKDLKKNKVTIEEVFTPFPVHGLDHLLDLKPTRLAITAFIYGCLGLTFGSITGSGITTGFTSSNTAFFTG